MYQKKNLTVFDLYMRLILIMPITTLFQNQIDAINKIVFIAIFLLQIYLLVKTKMTPNYVLLTLIALVVYVTGLINTTNLKFDNTIVYYINWIIYSTVILINKYRFQEWILEHEKYVYAITKLWTLLVAVSIVLPSSYYVKEGGSRYFGSYCKSIFRLGPTALFVATLAVIMIGVYKDRKAICFLLVPLYCGLMGSSRTYLIVIGLTSIIGLYFFSISRKQFLQILVPMALVASVVYSSSSIAQKVAYTKSDAQYGDFWYRITSSRSFLWATIIEHFNRLPLWNKIIGGGYNFSRDLLGHYAHNDFIEILATHGYSGVLLYLYSIIQLFKNYFENHPRKILVVSAVTIWLFNAMFNMFYYYICAALSFPFLLFAIDWYSNEKEII